MVVGTLIAWVLVRDEFRGKGLVNAVIDLPFALPTIVASIVLLSLYGPQSPIDVHLYATRPALVVALLFVTLPFVVRSVQPVLMEVDREAEEAAASLGASRLVTFRRSSCPRYPGAAQRRGTRIRPRGRRVRVRRADRWRHPARDRGRLAVHRQADRGGPAETAAAVSVTLLLIAFAVLVVLRLLAARTQRATSEADLEHRPQPGSPCASSRSATWSRS